MLTGSPIRAELLNGDKEAGYDFLKFDGTKPVLLVVGGSLGAQHINTQIRKVLPKLLEKFDICHICGKGNVDTDLLSVPGYAQSEYVRDNLKDLFAAADLFVSRAGANAICEIAALNKPNLLIPLSAKASRGDQILNAESFEKQGFSMVLQEEDMDDESIIRCIDTLWADRDKYIEAMKASPNADGVALVIKIIEETVG